MYRLLSILLAVTCIAGGGPAVAQVIPLPTPQMIPAPNPIPVPLLAPQPPPVINGPLSQSPGGVIAPAPLGTYSYGDGLTQCLGDCDHGKKGRSVAIRRRHSARHVRHD
jgi:hypothetical protein